MTTQDVSTPMLISHLARLMRTRFDRRTRHIGLTRAQWRTIACVQWEPGATQHRIATMLQVGDVTAGRSIDRLTEAGWMERRPDPQDRRAYRIYMTDKAQPELDRLSSIGQDEERIALAGMNEAEQAQLHRLLQHVVLNMTADDCDGVEIEDSEDGLTVADFPAAHAPASALG